MTTVQIVGLCLVGVLIVQWALAMIALMKLSKAKFPKRKFWVWNVAILAGIWVGPICFLILERRRKKTASLPQSGEDGGGNYVI